MNAKYEKWNCEIKRKHSFAWVPKFSENFRTSLNDQVFSAIAVQVFQALGWDTVFHDVRLAEAKIKDDWGKWTEKITVTYEFGKVQVESLSLNSNLWDAGKNSKRVKLFIRAFKDVEKTYSKESIRVLEKEIADRNNLSNYEIPESLPPPKERSRPILIIPFIGAILIAIITGYLIAYCANKVGYIIGLYEVISGILIGFCFKKLIELSNYARADYLDYMLIISVLLTFTLNQYFLYHFIVDTEIQDLVRFSDFIKMRLERGLIIDSLNTGWIGLVLSWGFQLFFTFVIAKFRLDSSLIQYRTGIVPIEVLDFTLYHLLKGKDLQTVRNELTAKGWSKEEDQNDVFYAISAIQNVQEFNRSD